MASFFFRGNALWVRGTIHGKQYRLSVNRKNTDGGFNTWFKKQNADIVLQNLITESEEKAVISFKTDLLSFGLMIIESKVRVGDATKADYARLLKDQIVPFLEQKGKREGRPITKDISLLNPNDVLNLTLYLQKQFSGSRAKRATEVLKTILDEAIVYKVIESTPFDSKNLKNLKFDTKPVSNETYTTSETKTILDNSKGWLRVYLEILFKYGLRAGEAMGLQWSDFDFENGVLYLQRSVTKGVINIGTQGGKNHERRIHLFPATVSLLKNYYEVRPHNEWLFVGKEKSYFKESKTIIENHFKPFLKEIGVPYKTIRATRRTHTSIMSFGGGHKEDIQEQIGHKKGSKVTEKHYIDRGVLTPKQSQLLSIRNEEIFDFMLENGC